MNVHKRPLFLAMAVAIVIALLLLVNGAHPALTLQDEKNQKREFYTIELKRTIPSALSFSEQQARTITIQRVNAVSVDSLNCSDTTGMASDQKDACNLKQAKQNGSLESCYKINSGATRDTCFWEVAKKQKKKSYCNLIKDSNLKLACENDFS